MIGFPVESSQRIVLNVHAASRDAAVAVAHSYGCRVLVGVVARDFVSGAEGAAHIRALQENGVTVSAGLGDGAASEWERALQMALLSRPAHLNQVFPAAALSQRALSTIGATTVVNALVRPTGVAGRVQVTTGPQSQAHDDGILPVDAALDMLLEVGVRSVKLFPIQGESRLEEVATVAHAAAARNMMFEPTGGITPANLAAVVRSCLDAGIDTLMPHLYGSMKDPVTRELSLGLLEKAMSVICRFDPTAP